jgi:hypothetical protein
MALVLAPSAEAKPRWGYQTKRYDDFNSAHLTANIGMDGYGGVYFDVPPEATAVRVRLVDESGLPVRALVHLPGGDDFHDNPVCGLAGRRFELERGGGGGLYVSLDAGVYVGGGGGLEPYLDDAAAHVRECPASVSAPTSGVVKVQFLR